MSIKQKILVVTHCKAISDIKIPEKYLFNKLDIVFENSIVGYENFCLYLLKETK